MMLIPLQFRPGIFRNGTKYQAKGRWYDASLVRWFEGAMQPIGGWENLALSDGTAYDITGAIRGMLGWRSNGGTPYLAAGTATNAYGFSVGVNTDITPVGFTTGNTDAQQTTGQYGQGIYGIHRYGVGNEAQSVLTEANTWQFDSWGEELVGMAYSDGKLYSWDLILTNNLVQMSNSPDGCRGIVVTPERFVVALGGSLPAGGSSSHRTLFWCDQEDYTVWTPQRPIRRATSSCRAPAHYRWGGGVETRL